MWSLNKLHVELKSREKSCEFKFCKDSYHQKLNRKEEKSKQNTYLLKALANSRKIRLEQERYQKNSKIWEKLQIDNEKEVHSVRKMKHVISQRMFVLPKPHLVVLIPIYDQIRCHSLRTLV